MSWELQGLLRDPGLPLVTGSTLHSNVGDGSFTLAFHSIWKEFHPSSPFSKHNERPVWQITGSVDIPLARIQCCLCGPAGICTADLLCQQIFIFVDEASKRLQISAPPAVQTDTRTKTLVVVGVTGTKASDRVEGQQCSHP